jgi:hypothetical protein
MKELFALRHLALAVSALLAARGQAQASSAEELRQRYTGDYVYSGGAEERRQVPAAVERSVEGMFFIARGIAYDRLLHVCEVCASYTLSFSGGELAVSGPCQWPDRGPDDGREVEHRTKWGDASKLSQRFVDGALVQDFHGEGGSRHVVWRLLDAERLSVQVTITSEHLPHAVDYTLSYRRVAPAGATLPAPDSRDAGP